MEISPSCTLCQRTTESSGTGQQIGLIEKPRGEMSRPRRGGYNLRGVLAWSDEQWNEVTRFVRLTVTEKLDLEKPITKQKSGDIDDVRQVVLGRFPFLINYSNLWVIDDLVRSRLQYEKKRLQRDKNARMLAELRAEAVRQARRAAFEAVESAFSARS
ncbi:hypothetical protein F5050DRAFT_1811717 [Lentinula boryana]|uniref:Uncharacterized protein n=1 Tax=Lentinula boryana TaxID=40481 RepID=A0ABQ8Q195_9AGAR|nr:hypothetical protein F5050DRAFT_1811717 [Lentinula boryana]